MNTALPTHRGLRHPLTGRPLRAVGVRRDGRPIWPVLGGDDTLTVPSTLPEMRARVEAIGTERRELHTAAGDAALSEEQQTRWDALDAEETRLGTEMAPLVEAEARAARVTASRARWQSTEFGRAVEPAGGRDVMRMSGREVRDAAMATVDSRETGAHLSDAQRSHVERLLRTSTGDCNGEALGRLLLATEDPAYRSAFQRMTASTVPILSAEEGRAVEAVRAIKRAMNITTDGAGGFAVPILIDPTVMLTGQGSPNDILRLARVEVITNDEWKGLSSAGVSWAFAAESAEVGDGTPTIAQPTVTTRRAQGFIPFSIEIEMDWPSFAENMSMMLAEGYDELLAEKLTTGTQGSNEPNGLIAKLDATAAIEVEVATAGTIAAGDVYGLWDALPNRWRRAVNTAFMSSTNVQNSIRQLGTTDPNFSANITVSDGVTPLFGQPYPVNDFMQDDPAGTGTQALLVVGDFRQYLVAQRAGMTVELVPHLFATANNRPSGQRGYFAWARIGADVLIPGAFRLLVNKSA